MNKVPVLPIYAHEGANRMIRHVDFPTLDHFIEDVQTAGIDEVRIDMFESSRTTELSFVYYVSLILVVTAVDAEDGVIYEFGEVEETVTATEPHLTDELVRKRAEGRMADMTHVLQKAGLRVGHGRFMLDTQP